MRYGSVLVPLIIAGSTFVIVGAESGWFDEPEADPIAIHADHDTAAVRSMTADRPVPETGRSVGTLDTDRTAGAIEPAAEPAPAESIDPLIQARTEAAKARQDVVDVTRASIAAQAAEEAEAARQKAELVDEVAQLTAKVDAQAEHRRAAEDSVHRLQTDLAAARDEAKTLKRRLAEREPTPQPVAPEMAAPDVAARLRDDLDGARRGEATLRQENAVLQRELVQAKQAAATSTEPENGRSVATDGPRTSDRPPCGRFRPNSTGCAQRARGTPS